MHFCRLICQAKDMVRVLRQSEPTFIYEISVLEGKDFYQRCFMYCSYLIFFTTSDMTITEVQRQLKTQRNIMKYHLKTLLNLQLTVSRVA